MKSVGTNYDPIRLDRSSSALALAGARDLSGRAGAPMQGLYSVEIETLDPIRTTTPPVNVGFLQTLEASQIRIAHHALAAWDGWSVDLINSHLEQARSLLRQIVGKALAEGHRTIGAKAQHCVKAINAHLEGPYSDLAICPGEIIWHVDNFVESCSALSRPS